jgi:nitrate/nitrite-specific signal transduction histidine kinase
MRAARSTRRPFRFPDTVTPGIGMTTVSERAGTIYSTLTLDSMAGGGTRVIVKWSTQEKRR